MRIDSNCWPSLLLSYFFREIEWTHYGNKNAIYFLIVILWRLYFCEKKYTLLCHKLQTPPNNVNMTGKRGNSFVIICIENYCRRYKVNNNNNTSQTYWAKKSLIKNYKYITKRHEPFDSITYFVILVKTRAKQFFFAPWILSVTGFVWCYCANNYD